MPTEYNSIILNTSFGPGPRMIGLIGTGIVSLLLLVSGSMHAAGQNRNDPGKGGLYRSLPKVDIKERDRSHSHLGPAFDQGPRQHAKLEPGMGTVHFPVTTSDAMAQKFMDQGVNLLYCFSWYEAERSFREAAFHDPECAMAYWGMAMCDNDRGKEFLALASTHLQNITDREKRYIDALAINFRGGDEKSRIGDNTKALEAITLAYPNDVEAKAMLAWALFRQQQNGDVTYRVAIDALLKQVIAKNPLHPGAHHFRIHMWDGVGAENVLDSCKAFAKASPEVGHALHMPGHIYARLGMWDDATHAMDASARAERKYFYDDHQLPYESWDYGHDQDFLISSLGYNGRLNEGIGLSWELIDIPHDPQFNNGSSWSTAGTGRFSLMRMLIRGERWDEILTGRDSGWNKDDGDQFLKTVSRCLAYIGKNDKANASKEIAALDKIKSDGDTRDCARKEVKAKFAIMNGDYATGIDLLKKAAETEKAKFKFGDPIDYPQPIYESLAWAQIGGGKYADAEETLKEGLERNPDNGFALCLKIQLLVAEGKRPEAAQVYGQLTKAWSHADPNIPALARVKALHLEGTEHSASFPAAYHPPTELMRTGPERWLPFPAPMLNVKDESGKIVNLDEYRGHNVLLVFTLGGSCPRCNKQLDSFTKESAAFAALDTKLLSVSSDTPNSIKAYMAGTPNPAIRVLSDLGGKAAQRFKAHDDFENLDLHATFLIDKSGRVWWYRSSVEPFEDVAFLKDEIVRMDAWPKYHDMQGNKKLPAKREVNQGSVAVSVRVIASLPSIK